MLILWKCINISVRTLLVCWKFCLCWSHNSHWLYWDQDITADLYQCEMKITLQDIFWNLTNQKKQLHSSLPANRSVHSSESYMEMPNVSCFVHCYLDRLAYGVSELQFQSRTSALRKQPVSFFRRKIQWIHIIFLHAS